MWKSSLEVVRETPSIQSKKEILLGCDPNRDGPLPPFAVQNVCSMPSLTEKQCVQTEITENFQRIARSEQVALNHPPKLKGSQM